MQSKLRTPPNYAPTLKVPTPGAFQWGSVSETGKATSFEVAFLFWR